MCLQDLVKNDGDCCDHLSWKCPGPVLNMAKCPQIMLTVCPVWTFEYWFDGAFVHVAPHTSTIIQKSQFFHFLVHF